MAEDTPGYLPLPQPTVDMSALVPRVTTRGDDDVAELSEECAEDAEARKLCRDIYCGSDHMKSLGTQRLPQEPAEEDADYQLRLNRGYLFNGVKRAAKTLAGKPFTKPVKRSADMSPQISALLEDVDFQGNRIDVFARNLFEDALIDGIAFILIDMPDVLPPGATTAKMTLRDIEDQKVRPYWVALPADRIIGFRFEAGSGPLTKLTQVRMRMDRMEPVGMFGSAWVRRVRVWEPGVYADYIYNEKERRWEFERGGVFGLPYIPIVPVPMGKAEPMRGRPPLRDLADINLVHYQSTADQRHILHVARVPILAGFGIEASDDEEMIISPNTAVLNRGTGSLTWVETTGGSIGAGRQDLLDLQSQMAEAALELLVPAGGNFTATAASLNAADSVSEMQANAMAFADAMNRALQITAEMMPIGGGEKINAGTVEIHSDFAFSYRDIEEMNIIFQARVNKDIARKYYVEAMDRRGILGPDFDATENERLLSEEQKTDAALALQAATKLASTMPPPGAGPKNREPIGSTEKTKQAGTPQASA